MKLMDAMENRFMAFIMTVQIKLCQARVDDMPKMW